MKKQLAVINNKPADTVDAVVNSKSTPANKLAAINKLERGNKIQPSRARTRMLNRIGSWRHNFLFTLAKTPSVTVAARAAGIDRATAYKHRYRDPAFAEAWDDALAQSLDVLEHSVYVRALKDDAQLAMFVLKAHRPSLYSDKLRHEVGVVGGIVLVPQKEDKEP